jgi:hypothetical protein
MISKHLQTLIGLHPLPWQTDLEQEAGVIYDAAGSQVLAVDQWNDLPDRDVHAVAVVVTACVNFCGEIATVHAPTREPFLAAGAGGAASAVWEMFIAAAEL